MYRGSIHIIQIGLSYRHPRELSATTKLMILLWSLKVRLGKLQRYTTKEYPHKLDVFSVGCFTWNLTSRRLQTCVNKLLTCAKVRSASAAKVWRLLRGLYDRSTLSRAGEESRGRLSSIWLGSTNSSSPWYGRRLCRHLVQQQTSSSNIYQDKLELD